MNEANDNEMSLARVAVDALAGQGMLFVAGTIVDRATLSEYFDSLVASGALELCHADPLRLQGIRGDVSLS